MNDRDFLARFVLVGKDNHGNKNARLEYEVDPSNSVRKEMNNFFRAFQRAFDSSRDVIFEDVSINIGSVERMV